MTERSNTLPISPWISIWTRPRQTIQRISDDDPEQSLLLVISLAGFIQFLNNASSNNLGNSLAWPAIIVIGAILGPIGSILGLYIASALVKWTGVRMGGSGTMASIRAAMAWSQVPVIWTLVLWVPMLALLGQDMFTAAMPRLEASPGLGVLLLLFVLVQVMVSLWGLVLLLKCLGQVQGFSAWKALANVLLAGLALLVPIVLLSLAVTLLAGAPG